MSRRRTHTHAALAFFLPIHIGIAADKSHTRKCFLQVIKKFLSFSEKNLSKIQLFDHDSIRFINNDDTSNPNGAAEINFLSSSTIVLCRGKIRNRCKFHFDNSCIYHLIKIELINLSLLFFLATARVCAKSKKREHKEKNSMKYTL